MVTPLAPLVATEGTATERGLLRAVLDDATHALLYQYDEQPIQSLPLPPDFDSRAFGNILTIPEHGEWVVICHGPAIFPTNDRSISFRTLYVADLAENQIVHFGPDDARDNCQFTNQPWHGVESLSWEMVSPDGQYRVYVAPWSPACRARNTIFVQSARSVRVAGCTGSESIRFDRWLDDDRLLLRYVSPYDSTPPLSALLVLSARDATLTPLTGLISRFRDDLLLYDAGTKLLLVRRDDDTHPFEYWCHLSILDLTSYESHDIEPTACFHDAHIDLNAETQTVLYVNHTSDGSDFDFAPYSEVHRVDLRTGEVTRLPLVGTIVELINVSPGQDRLVVVVDDGEDAGVGANYGGGGMRHYDQPRIIFYDAQRDTVLFEREGVVSPWDRDGALPGFEWTATGWRTFLNQHTAPPLLVQGDGAEVETRVVADLPLSSRYTVTWSPDNTRAIVQLADLSAFVVTVSDTSVRMIMDVGEQPLRLRWEDAAHILVETDTFDQVVVDRWLVEL